KARLRRRRPPTNPDARQRISSPPIHKARRAPRCDRAHASECFGLHWNHPGTTRCVVSARTVTPRGTLVAAAGPHRPRLFQLRGLVNAHAKTLLPVLVQRQALADHLTRLLDKRDARGLHRAPPATAEPSHGKTPGSPIRADSPKNARHVGRLRTRHTVTLLSN